MEINGIKLSDKDKQQIFTKYNSGNNINEKLDLSKRNKTNRNQILYKEALAAIYVNMGQENPLE